MKSDRDIVFSPDDRPWVEPGSAPYPVTVDRRLCTIAQMAAEFGITPRALRFYENKGLLSPVRDGKARLYGWQERDRLALVLQAKRLGFTLAEIRQMLATSAGPADGLSMSRRQCVEQIRLLEARKHEIEAALAELRRTYSSCYVRIAKAP